MARISREIVMGIDVGSSAVKTIIAEVRKDEARPYILGAGISPSLGLRRGCVINPHDTAVAIRNSVKKAQETTDAKIKQAFISIGGTGIEGVRSKGSVAVSRADREIGENDLKRATGQSEAQLSRNSSSYMLNREIVHSFPLSYKVDDELVIGSPIGNKGEKLETETLFITGQSQHLNNLIRSMEMAGIVVEDVVADCWAMSHVLAGQREKEVGCVLVNVGADTSSTITFEEGNPISLEVFPIGSNHITFDIARGFQVTLDEAEQLKLSYASDPVAKRKLNGIVEPRLNDIFELVENHLNKIKRAKLLPAGIILTGGGTNLEGIDEAAKRSLQLPTQLIKPSFPGYSKNAVENPIWSVALGLCLRGLGKTREGNEATPGGFGFRMKNGFVRLFKNFLP